MYACWVVISEIICVNHIQSLESHLKNKRRSFSLRHLFSTSTEISHSAIWQWGSCTPVNESDCLFSFNQHLVSEKKENFPSSLCMFFQGLIVVRCREWLVIYVPTHFILFFKTSFVQMVLERSSEICLSHFSAEANNKTPQVNLEVTG